METMEGYKSITPTIQGLMSPRFSKVEVEDERIVNDTASVTSTRTVPRMSKRCIDGSLNFRLSPMASALIQQKHGVYLPPTHVSTPSKSTRILSPACSPALRDYFKQDMAVEMPDLAKPYRHRTTIGITLQPEEATDVSQPPRKLLTKGSSCDGSSYVLNVPFYPALYDTVTGAVQETADAFIKANFGNGPSLFTARAPKLIVRKRAVIIGIAYKDSKFQRESLPHGEAAQKWFDVLVRHLEFLTEEIWVLCDLPVHSTGRAILTQPTYQNIQKALKWLTKGARPGDRLFLSYNGDVAYQKTKQTDVTWPVMHAMVPSDYPNKPSISDDQLHDMIKNIEKGIDLTIFLDCRMSWNLIRLPIIYVPFKSTRDAPFKLGRALTAEHWDLPHLATPSGELIRPPPTHDSSKEQQEVQKHLNYFDNYRKLFNTPGNVVCFAATPARYRRFRRYKTFGVNWLSKGDYTNALIDVIADHASSGTLPTYRTLMFESADFLCPPGTMFQVPQVCATSTVDLDRKVPL